MRGGKRGNNGEKHGCVQGGDSTRGCGAEGKAVRRGSFTVRAMYLERF